MFNLKNKKVTVMGLGLYQEGSGISATKFLLSAGAKVTVTDLKTEAQLAEQLKRLGKLKTKINFVLGKHREQDFKNVDLIIKNPGVPASSRFLKIAEKNKIPVYTDISLFFEFFDRSRIIGITGTRGKSTTASLIYELIKKVDRGAILGGNIKKSPLLQLEKIKAGSTAVLELSSWMLESLELIKKSPHISVFTNIYPDHLNTYRGMAEYVEAKKNIFKFQNLQDYLIINRDNPYTLQAGKEAVGRRVWFSVKYFKEENGCYVKDEKIIFRFDGVEQKVCSLKEVTLPGKHNLENVLAATAVALIFGVKIIDIKKVLKSFKGIEDRLELLKEIRGVKYYNDTTSTTPEATMAALRTLGQSEKKIILIAGGSDKGLEFKELIKEIKKYCQAVILLKGSGTERLKPLLLGIKNLPLFEVDSMDSAVKLAQSLAVKQDFVLLSPACASFGMFVNEFDRGAQFRKLVGKLK
jgi:UDP-N-acetylmuramoylalanine--D-glutamate ligase